MKILWGQDKMARIKLNVIQDIIASIFNIPKEREIVQDIKVEAENKDLRGKLAHAYGQVGRLNKILKKRQKEAEDQDVKKEITLKLLEESEKIEKEELGDYVPFEKLFAKIYDFNVNKKTKWGEKLIFSDKDGKKSYKYGSMGFTTKGHFVIKDAEGNIINIANLPRRLFKLEGIRTQLKKGMIFMNVDEEGDFHEEVEDLTIPSQTYSEDEHTIVETEELRVKAIDLIREKIMELRVKEDKVSQLELEMDDKNKEIDRLRRMSALYEKGFKINSADTSKMADAFIEHSKGMFTIAGKVINLSESLALQEKQNESLDSQNDELRNKAEIMGTKTSLEKAKALYQDAVDFNTGREIKMEQKKHA